MQNATYICLKKIISLFWRWSYNGIKSYLSSCRGNRKPGAATILSNDWENFLIHVIHKYQEWQMPLTRSDLISIARTFMIEFDKQKYYERFVIK